MNQQSNHNPFDILRSASLSADERADMRRRLVAHIAANPRRSGLAAFVLRPALMYGLASVLLFAGGTAALAQHAMPGSLFYPVRLAVNDRVAIAFAGNDDAQLDAQLAQIGRMIDDEQSAGYGDLAQEQLADGAEDAPKDTQADQLSNDLNGIQHDLQDVGEDGPPQD